MWLLLHTPLSSNSWITCILVFSFTWTLVTSSNYEKLTRHNIEPGGITVSGLSGGGSFSSMLAFIYSSFIKGVGLFAGAPMGTISVAIENPVNALNFTHYRTWVDYLDSRGFIDDTKNVQKQRIWVYHGAADQIVPLFLSRFNLGLFRYYNAAATKDMIAKIPSSHCIPIDLNNDLRICSIFYYYAMCSCGYNGVNDMLSFLYPENWKAPNREVLSGRNGRLFKFDQDEFFPEGNATYYGFREYGWAYVPERCDPETGIFCKLHFFFHGCGQAIVAMLFNQIPPYVANAGFLEAADANDIIVIFPHVDFDISGNTFNYIGCFDLYGYTSWLRITYQTKWGVQPQAIKKMYEKLLMGSVAG